MIRACRVAAVCALVLLVSASAQGITVYVTTADQATLGGLTFAKGDVVAYDTVADLSTLYFSQDLFRRANGNFGEARNIDALHILSADSFLFSTTMSGNIGQPLLNFLDGDIVRYNKSSDTASIAYPEGSIFVKKANGVWVPSIGEDIDALHVLSNGHILVSTVAGAFVGSNALAVKPNDVAEFDPVTGLASLFMDGGTMFFYANGKPVDAENIDGLFVDETAGLAYYSVTNGAYVRDTLTTVMAINKGDILAYDLETGLSTVFLSVDEFVQRCNTENIDGISILGVSTPSSGVVPEPMTALCMAAGLGGIGAYLRRRLA